MALSKGSKFQFHLQGQSLRLTQVLLTVAPAFITYGYNQAGIGPLATLQTWVHTFPEIDTVNTSGAIKETNSTRKGAVIASLQLGALLGALSCTYLGDLLGRRKTIFLAALITVIGELLETSSFGTAQLTTGRVILGIGVGQLSATVPVFQAECSAAKHRGRHVVVDGICMVLGFVLCNWIDFGLSKASGAIQWRVPLALSFLFPLMVLVSVFALPESPRWLVLVGRTGDAAASLSAYRGLPADDEAVQAEIAGIESALELTERSGGITLRDVFFGKDEERLLYRFTLCMVIQFFQQMCGGNLISTYLSTIFEQNLKLDSDLSRILAASALTWKFLCNFIPFFAIDRLGRRKVFILSGTGMCLCMTILTITTALNPEGNHKPLSYASVVFIWLFNLFYPIGFSGANFLYCTEVAPTQLRVAMSAASTANKWLWNFIVVMITPVALNTIGWRYYILYAVISTCIPVTVYLFYPETMGRSLEGLGAVFRDAKSIWEVVEMAKRMPAGDIGGTGAGDLEGSKEKEVLKEHA
ncbi:general substrate transporter [Aspergillus granulosus]|uniref:General substrate transporter n=1 Tax=Aspergillus granulosus TaxID=176169 RepID=A0ABR4HEP6_9EURO